MHIIYVHPIHEFFLSFQCLELIGQQTLVTMNKMIIIIIIIVVVVVFNIAVYVCRKIEM